MSEETSTLTTKARIAEQAERYEDMAKVGGRCSTASISYSLSFLSLFPSFSFSSVHEGGDGEGDGRAVTRRQESVERGLQKRGGYTAQFLESHLQHRTKILGREQEGDGQGLQREDREGVGRHLQ